VAKFFQDDDRDLSSLIERAQALRDSMADDDFGRDVLDHNADYIDRLAAVYPIMTALPATATVLPSGASPPINLSGVMVTSELQFWLRRLTKTNKVRVGAVTFRYAKGKTLPAAVGSWQSAFVFGYINQLPLEDGAEPENKLCLTLDAYSGVWHSAPTDSVRRFHEMSAACLTVAERWPNISPPSTQNSRSMNGGRIRNESVVWVNSLRGMAIKTTGRAS
jgi:hypothetical protein